MVKVSVIVPIYNAEKYLKQCLDSIMNQTLTDIEIILIDDGSTDGSREICESYLTDSRVIFHHKENEGLAAARQDGMERAQGEYMGFVDSDDWLEPDMYEKMYRVAQSNVSDVVFCNCIENENGHRFTPEMPSGPYDRAGIEAEVLPRTLAYVGKDGGKRAIRWSNCLRIYRTEFLRQNGIAFDRGLRRSQDLQLTYLSMLKAKNFYYLGDDYLYHNRVVKNYLSRGYTKNMWPLYVKLINHLYDYTEEHDAAELQPKKRLMEQMHLRAFFFADACVENELVKGAHLSRKEKLAKLEEIINDPICERYYGHIPAETLKKLNPQLRGTYRLIHKKNAQGLMVFTTMCIIKGKIKNGWWLPLKRKICATKLYKAVRG